MFLKIVPVAVATMFSISAFAVEKEITVTAQIDPTIELLAPDGEPLPSVLNMDHIPGKGLRKQSFDAKIFSNDKTKDVEIRLQNEPKLMHTINTDAKAIDLTVSVDGKQLKTGATTLTAADLFDDEGSISKSLSFAIEQKTPGAVETAGLYRGPVRLVVTHAAGATD